MIQVIAQHPTEDRKVIITYMQKGYAEVTGLESSPLVVSPEVESSFVGASMFGWHAPVADEAHAFCKIKS